MTSPRLEFLVEVYENTLPGSYGAQAVVNFTYQRDVAVHGDEDRPEDPDIYYWYDALSQALPLTLRVERRSDVDFAVVAVSPESIRVGSKDNIVRITIENAGSDTARDLVAKLRPESGIYVSVDESPIPRFAPGDQTELTYKLDVSEDAVPEKRYRLTLLFDFSDTYRDHLEDSEDAYIVLSSPSIMPVPWAIVLAAMVIAGAAFLVYRKRRGAR